MKDKIKIVLADDNKDFCQVLKEYLSNEEDIEILSKLCANAFTSCVLRWIKEGMKTDFEYVLRRISVMLDGAFTAALKNAADYDKKKM